MSAYEFTMQTLSGEEQNLADYNGKVTLIVNVASECGLTPQYTQLQALYEKYQDKNFQVVGFPCNQFGAQEPGSAEQIASFCETRYQVTFPMMEKVDVNGANRADLYTYLAGDGAAFPGDITWNFEKFLVDKTGAVVQRFSPKTAPDAPEIIEAIEALV